MIQVIVGGLLAVLGGVIGSIINAYYQKRYLDAQDKYEQRKNHLEHRARTYYETISTLTQFLQFLHPSVEEKHKGKYSAGVSFVEYVTALSKIQAGIQLYGSEVAGTKLMEFFSYYNSIPWDADVKQITDSHYSELNRIARELQSLLRQELHNVIQNSEDMI